MSQEAGVWLMETKVEDLSVRPLPEHCKMSGHLTRSMFSKVDPQWGILRDLPHTQEHTTGLAHKVCKLIYL